MHTAAMIFLLIRLLFTSDASNPAINICIWSATSHSEINGLYTHRGLYEGNSRKPYYKKNGYSCIGGDDVDTEDDPRNQAHFLFYDGTWNIGTSQDQNDSIAYCLSSESIENCTEWYTSYGRSNISVFVDTCPIWDCDQISIPSLDDGCNITFDKNLKNNIWTNSPSTRFLFFNPLQMHWNYDDKYPNFCVNSYLSYTDQGWTDLHNDQSVLLHFYPLHRYHTVYCMRKPSVSLTYSPSPPATQILDDDRFATIEPTASLTYSPVVSPISETIETTASPTLLPIVITQMTTRSEMSYPASSSNHNKNSFWLIFGISTAVSGVCVGCVIAAYYVKKTRKLSDDLQLSCQFSVGSASVLESVDVPGLQRVHTESKPHVDDIDIEIKLQPDPKSNECSVNSNNEDEPRDVNEGVEVTQGEPPFDEGQDNALVAVKDWLTNDVLLPQYYEVLVCNGYDRLDIIKEISKPQELEEIGVALKGHALKLMKEIEKLKNYVTHDTNTM